MMRLSVLFLLAFGILPAQDAELVLRTSVSYRTMLASRPLAPAQKEEADQLSAAARASAASGKYGEAMRHLAQGTALMMGEPWSPALELASSFQARVDHAVPAPGASIQLTLTPLYPTVRPLTAPMSLAVYLRQPGATPGAPLVDPVEIDPSKLPITVAALLPSGVTGNYELLVRLRSEKLNLPGRSVPIQIVSLGDSVEALNKRLRKTANPTAEYAVALYERADQGAILPHRIDFAREFLRANSILNAVGAGRDPFAGQTGDIRKAYRSPVDETLQPYRLFIPSAYDGSQPVPLLIALHGMGGDENSMFDGYEGRLKQEAEKRGILVAAPKGRNPASMYRDTAEKDVLDVLAEVRRDYRIDPRRIFLMGHSMGAYGTWSIAVNHPDLFTALGPVSGGGAPAGMAKIKHIPQYVVHGDNDKTVSVEQSRGMVAAAKALSAPVTYVEVPGGSHSDIVVPNFAPMLDYFLAKTQP